MSVLVIGRDGQLSESLLRAAPGLTAYGLDRVDLTRPEEAEAAVIAARPSLVINAAAHTAVDKAESEEDLAYAINATGAEALARGAAKVGAGIVQISTDYVFPGDKDGEWLEDDPVAPLGAYGRTKLAGERLVMAANPRACVIRTAWVYCDIGANFVKTMLRLADRDRLTVVADQRGKPTSAIFATALRTDGSLCVATTIAQLASSAAIASSRLATAASYAASVSDFVAWMYPRRPAAVSLAMYAPRTTFAAMVKPASLAYASSAAKLVVP